MKRLLLLLLLAPLCSMGQIHIKRQSFLQINVGAYDRILPSLDSYSISAEIGKYNKKLNATGFGFMYAHKLAANGVPVDKYVGFAKTELNVFSSANLTTTFKILGIGQFGYEAINKDQKIFNAETLQTPSGFVLALGTGAELELSPLVLGVRTTYNFLSSYQKFSTYPYVGIKIHFQ